VLFSDWPWVNEFRQKPSGFFVKNEEKFSSHPLFEQILPWLNDLSVRFGNPQGKYNRNSLIITFIIIINY